MGVQKPSYKKFITSSKTIHTQAYENKKYLVYTNKIYMIK